MWQHDKRTDDNKIILNCVRKLMKNKCEKEAVKGLKFKKMFVSNLEGKLFCKYLLQKLRAGPAL